MKKVRVGILAFHGDVSEHAECLAEAAKKEKTLLETVFVRTKQDLKGLHGLIISGGESTTMQKLCEREEMWEEMKKVPAVFGTCAGAILLAKNVGNKAPGQKTLKLMDIEVVRNAYGRQDESFEEKIETRLGPVEAVFIRAPKITSIGKNVEVLSKRNGEVIACEQKSKNHYYLATSFHPEFTTTLFHERFLKYLTRQK